MHRVLVAAVVVVLFMSGCGGGGNSQSPVNSQGSANNFSLASFFPQFNETPPADAFLLVDAVNDLMAAPSGAPPTVSPYPPVDLTRVYLWRSGDYLYMRAEFNGTIPETPPVIGGETVEGVSVNIYMDWDSRYDTGAKNLNTVDDVPLGVDVVYGISMRPGGQPVNPAVALYDLGLATDLYGARLIGEFRGGGPGHTYACARYSLSALMGKYYVPGATATLLASSETASTHYHHFAFDATRTVTWVLP